MEVKEKPFVEISIPIFNQWASTFRLIKSLIRSTKYENCRINFIDNASTDETANELKKFTHFNVIRNETNVGFGNAHNQVMLNSEADYFCLVNNDVEVPQGWLTKLVEEAEKNEMNGLVAPVNRTRGKLIIGSQ